MNCAFRTVNSTNGFPRQMSWCPGFCHGGLDTRPVLKCGNSWQPFGCPQRGHYGLSSLQMGEVELLAQGHRCGGGDAQQGGSQTQARSLLTRYFSPELHSNVHRHWSLALRNLWNSSRLSGFARVSLHAPEKPQGLTSAPSLQPNIGPQPSAKAVQHSLNLASAQPLATPRQAQKV